jgi:hypothetical protein
MVMQRTQMWQSVRLEDGAERIYFGFYSSLSSKVDGLAVFHFSIVPYQSDLSSSKTTEKG